ncbi:uncharacterized protein [Musca autumnalis]|uniref:uncharacterized protein n=1 Tax=Musca autumnalis TaxID=221902 RepID=UPI003CF37B39
MSQTPRQSERPNKGKAPKRYEMEDDATTNSPATTSRQELSAEMAATTPTQDTDRQQPDILKALANMQKEMTKQINAVQKVINTQKEQTAASIKSLQKEIKAVAEKVDGKGQSTAAVSGEVEGVQIDAAASAATSNNGESLINNSFHSQGSASHKAKIYPLPKFGGLPEEWSTFVEDFRQTTAEFAYTPLQNIIRIREALYGDARETVESLLSSSKNVEMIISTLSQTFGRPEQLIRSQIDKVSAISYVPEVKLDLLEKFSTKVTNMVRFLQTADGKHHLSNPTLLSELVSKLPQSKQMQWAEKCISLDRPVDLVDFCEWLDNVKRIANMVSDGLPSAPAHQNKRSQNKNKFAFTASVGHKCVICSGSCQSITNCHQFKNLPIDDRWKKARDLRLCFSCLKGQHQVVKCFNKQRCGIDGCDKSHNYILHKTADTGKHKQTNVTACSETESPRRNFHAGSKSSEILFQMIPIKLYGPKKCISTYAFIDDGADATMLEWELGKQIGLQGRKGNLRLQWLNGHCSSQQSETVEVSISGTQNECVKYKISNIFLIKNLELPTQSFALNGLKCSSDLSKLPIENYFNIKPQMILSLTHAFLTVPIDVPMCPDDNGPIAVKTRLGWVVYGPCGTESEHLTKRVLHTRKSSAEDVSLESIMRQYFDTESCMVKLDAKPVLSKDDQRALAILKNTTTLRGGRFQCGLLWKSDKYKFPDSYSMALKRLQLVERKFKTNKKLEMGYRSKMRHLLNEGYARRLTAEEEKIISDKTFFLPHFAVVNPRKDSLRLVFDAAAKVQGVSLNDHLLPGPDLNQSLLSVMFKFREKPIAVCGDIKEMFLQVGIIKEDQEAQRFLYRESESQPVSQYVMTRAIFGATCSPTIAQYVKNTNAEIFVDKYPRAVEAIIRKHYVDDYVDCFSSVEEAIKVVEEVITIH